MSDRGDYEDYLGDGLYVDFDGYQVWLAANDRVKGYPTDKVALDPKTLEAFARYLKRLLTSLLAGSKEHEQMKKNIVEEKE